VYRKPYVKGSPLNEREKKARPLDLRLSYLKKKGKPGCCLLLPKGEKGGRKILTSVHFIERWGKGKKKGDVEAIAEGASSAVGHTRREKRRPSFSFGGKEDQRSPFCNQGSGVKRGRKGNGKRTARPRFLSLYVLPRTIGKGREGGKRCSALVIGVCPKGKKREVFLFIGLNCEGRGEEKGPSAK